MEGRALQFEIDVGAILDVRVQVGNCEFNDLPGRGRLVPAGNEATNNRDHTQICKDQEEN